MDTTRRAPALADAGVAALAVALIDDYPSLIEALKYRRYSLGMSQMEFDARAGWADGYASKIEISHTAEPTMKTARALGKESLPLILGALDVTLALVPKHGATHREKAIVFAAINGGAQQILAERGRKGGEARRDRMTPAQRRRAARKAARARWAKERMATDAVEG
jgi:transcriptional regulator with XRE-family HTH domain